MNLRRAKKIAKLKASQQVSAAGPVLTDKQQEIVNLKKRFIELYPEYGTVGATLKQIGLKSRTTFYDWLKDDPEFKSLYEKQLQPDRRDVVASTIYRAALGKEKLNKDQLTAAFGFLRATEASKAKNKETADDLIFTEHNKTDVDLTTEGKAVNFVIGQGYVNDSKPTV